MSSDRASSVSLPPAGGRRKGAWWLWPLLALLAAVLLIALLASCGDDDDESSSASAPTTATAPAVTPTATTEEQLQPGVLTAGETAVVAGQGFFVAADQGGTDSIYVELGGTVGEDEEERGLPTVGDRVDLSGPVRPAPGDPERTLKLDGGQAQRVTDQGAFVNADQVTPK